jgi:hypothetical protein
LICVWDCATATSKISVKYTNIFHFTTCNLKLLEIRLYNIILLVTSYKTNIITNKMIVQRGPGGEEYEIFRNRKGYFSVNCQVTCDANMNILGVVAK